MHGPEVGLLRVWGGKDVYLGGAKGASAGEGFQGFRAAGVRVWGFRVKALSRLTFLGLEALWDRCFLNPKP